MNDDPAPHSKRADLRAERKTRRKQQLALREAVFDMIAAGYGYDVIAATLDISVATVRRDFDRAIDERRLDCARALRQGAGRAAQQGAEGCRRARRQGRSQGRRAAHPARRRARPLSRAGPSAPGARNRRRSPCSPCPLRRSRSLMPRRLLSGSWRTPARLQIWRAIAVRIRTNPFDWRFATAGFPARAFSLAKAERRSYPDGAAPGVWRKQRE